jgi:trk system potassium uptake protein TrkA
MKAIIIGGGQVGSYIASLLKDKCELKIVEQRESILAKLKNELPPDMLVCGSGTDLNVLESAGIAETDVVAAVTGEDETNLVASTIAKFEFNVPRVIARVNNPKNQWLFDGHMGVDVALNQAELMAQLVIEEMDLKNMLTLLKSSHGSYSIVQIKVDPQSEAVNKPIKDLNIPEEAVLIAMYRGNGVIIPRGNTVIRGGDDVLTFADADAKAKISTMFGASM